MFLKLLQDGVALRSKPLICCHNPNDNTTQPQHNLNNVVGLDTKMTVHTTPTPTQTQWRPSGASDQQQQQHQQQEQQQNPQEVQIKLF